MASTAAPASAATHAATPSPGPTPGPTPGTEPSPGPEPTPTLPALVDRSLLAVLPDRVAASPVEEDVDGEREFGADPGIAVRRYAAAVVGDGGENIAAASIAAVDPAGRDAFFTAWRAEFDAAVCAANGGVASSATASVGGRTAETTTCATGVRLYHLRLRGDTLLLSIMSIGPGAFGERLIEGLRE
ncbi:MAG: hypothetical protein MUC54_03690 [Chloroflexi bacterium]|nr:hypothetical protein [Chloroflexota bacterium]